MNDFLVPRVLAAVSAACLIAAVVVWPVQGLPWASGPLFVCAVIAGWMSHDLAASVRRRLAAETAARRLHAKTAVPRWSPPLTSLRVVSTGVQAQLDAADNFSRKVRVSDEQALVNGLREADHYDLQRAK